MKTFILIVESRKLRVGEDEIKLAPMEFRIVQKLIASKGSSVHWEHMAAAAFPNRVRYIQNPRRNLQVRVANIRRKLRAIRVEDYIESVLGEAWCITYKYVKHSSIQETGYTPPPDSQDEPEAPQNP